MKILYNNYLNVDENLKIFKKWIMVRTFFSIGDAIICDLICTERTGSMCLENQSL